MYHLCSLYTFSCSWIAVSQLHDVYVLSNVLGDLKVMFHFYELWTYIVKGVMRDFGLNFELIE